MYEDSPAKEMMVDIIQKISKGNDGRYHSKNFNSLYLYSLNS